MNKVAIVGHPASGLDRVESLLQRCGMQPALPSRREGMKPQEIAQALLKAHGRPPVEAVTDESALAPLEVGPVWHGMALDVLLGNLEQPFWGWSDPNTLYLLDYWRTLDPSVVFVLVYDHPRSALQVQRAYENTAGVQHEAAGHAIENWVAYNSQLLRFYLRHPERCVLVSADQVQSRVDAYLQQLSAKLQQPLALQAPVADTALVPVPQKCPETVVRAAESLGLPAVQAAEQWEEPEVERYLADALLAQYPQPLQLYEELQSAASLAPQESVYRAPDPMSAWQSLLHHRAWVAETLTKLAANKAQAQEQLAQLQRQLADTHQQALATKSLLEAELEAAREQAQAQAKAVAERDQKAKEQQEENELLLAQLHQVQEELERYYLQQQELTQRAERQAKELAAQTEQIKAQEAKLKDAQAAQAKLEAELKRAREKAAEELRAAQAAKTQLEAELKAAREQAQAQAKAVAERDQKAKEQQEENELLLAQLHQVQEELERYYLENQQLKAKLPKPKPPGPYGAADRIKRQLSYRLGAVMIQHSSSVGGWLRMPWALLAETRAFRKERAARANEKLPPIHTYRDAHQAERVKKHLSYRLGSTLIACTRSPLGWIKLPFALRQQVREFRREREGNQA